MPIGAVAELVGAVAPLLIAAAYLKRVHTLYREGRPVPAWRQISCGVSMVVILVAVGPLEGKAGELVLAHMGQHILLADVATLLVVFGPTGPLMQPLLANRLAHALRFLTHPVVAISIFTVNLFLWHSPPLYQAVLSSVPLHEAEHLSFIATGALLWMPLFGPCRSLWSDSIFYPDRAPWPTGSNRSPTSRPPGRS